MWQMEKNGEWSSTDQSSSIIIVHYSHLLKVSLIIWTNLCWFETFTRSLICKTDVHGRKSENEGDGLRSANEDGEGGVERVWRSRSMMHGHSTSTIAVGCSRPQYGDDGTTSTTCIK